MMWFGSIPATKLATVLCHFDTSVVVQEVLAAILELHLCIRSVSAKLHINTWKSHLASFASSQESTDLLFLYRPTICSVKLLKILMMVELTKNSSCVFPTPNSLTYASMPPTHRRISWGGRAEKKMLRAVIIRQEVAREIVAGTRGDIAASEPLNGNKRSVVNEGARVPVVCQGEDEEDPLLLCDADDTVEALKAVGAGVDRRRAICNELEPGAVLRYFCYIWIVE